MPDLTGIEVLRELNHLKDMPKLPIIPFSALIDEETAATALKLGATACILKRAVELERLVATIRAHALTSVA